MKEGTVHPKSLWSASVTPRRFESLNGDLKVQVLVIGGGMAGVL